MVGTTISHYKILEKLGEGGMGVVYKAEDTKLDRVVALKFLPARLATSVQDKARFIQEAKSAASLNHPNVCSIIDIQDLDGQMFIVMEFVDGQTLRDKEGSLSFKQAVDIGIQIADGLTAAHEKGIVHRDIKPENIMVRKDGICQIMDFGLAKLRHASSKINRLTMEGSTVGTAGYMSPEAVQGQDTDQRSDIFSLGVVLFELFTGQLPFKGVHETALLYEIVNVDAPPMSSVKPEIDPALDAIVLECLAKDPGERFQSVAEVGKELRRFKRESSRSRVSRVTSVRPIGQGMPSSASMTVPELAAPAAAPVKKSRPVLMMALAGVFFLSTVGLAYLHWRETTKELTPIRFIVTPPEKGSFNGDIPLISPDGLTVAFVAQDSVGKILIWLRPLSSLTPRSLPGTDGASYPFWSPDSRFLGFFQNGKLKKIEASGGPPQTIADAPQGRGGAWSSQGVIVFAPNYSGGIAQVSEAGGTPTEISSLDSARKEDSHRWPNMLPDGKHFTYERRSTDDEKTGVFLGSLDSKDYSLLVNVRSNAVYAAPGYLLYARESSLMAQPFDARKGALTGQAFPIADEVGFDQALTFGLFSASANGVLIFDMGTGAKGSRQLVWFDRTGKRIGEVSSTGAIFDFALSPDEHQVVFRRIDPQTQNQDLWTNDLLLKTESRFTFRPARDDDPMWSPDGTTIYFDSNPDGAPNLHRKIASGTGSEEILFKSATLNTPLDCSPDGKSILLQVVTTKGREDIWVFPLTGGEKPYPFLETAASEYSGRFSPDGRWVAYSSDESGKYEIYVQAFPKGDGKWQVSNGGGGNPMWGKDGKELFYLAPDKKLMAVDVQGAGAKFERGIPKPLFTTDVDFYASVNRFAVTADGQRFLINCSVDGKNEKPVAVIVNWTSEIRKQ